MAYQWASPPHHPAQYVSACCQGGAEGGREVYLPRPLAWPAEARLWGKHTHHMAGGLLDLSEGNLGPLPWGILTKKVTWPAALQALTEGRGHPRHPVLTEELLAEMVGTAMLEEDQCSAATAASWSICHPESQSRSHERENPHNEALCEAREAHQQALEATHMLKLNIKRLSQRAEKVQHWCPCSLSSSHLWSRSLDRQWRSSSQHRPERHVTFHDPEVELMSNKRSYREPWGHSTRAQLERGKEALCLYEGWKWYVTERYPWPTQALEIGWVIHWNLWLRTTRHGWIGEPAS